MVAFAYFAQNVQLLEIGWWFQSCSTLVFSDVCVSRFHPMVGGLLGMGGWIPTHFSHGRHVCLAMDAHSACTTLWEWSALIDCMRCLCLHFVCWWMYFLFKGMVMCTTMFFNPLPLFVSSISSPSIKVCFHRVLWTHITLHLCSSPPNGIMLGFRWHWQNIPCFWYVGTLDHCHTCSWHMIWFPFIAHGVWILRACAIYHLRSVVVVCSQGGSCACHCRPPPLPMNCIFFPSLHVSHAHSPVLCRACTNDPSPICSPPRPPRPHCGLSPWTGTVVFPAPTCRKKPCPSHCQLRRVGYIFSVNRFLCCCWSIPMWMSPLPHWILVIHNSTIYLPLIWRPSPLEVMIIHSLHPLSCQHCNMQFGRIVSWFCMLDVHIYVCMMELVSFRDLSLMCRVCFQPPNNPIHCGEGSPEHGDQGRQPLCGTLNNMLWMVTVIYSSCIPRPQMWKATHWLIPCGTGSTLSPCLAVGHR